MADTRARDGADDPNTQRADRIRRYLSIAEHIRRDVETWPPLTAEERADLAALLRLSTDDGRG